MIDPSWKKTEIDDFGGAWTFRDTPDVPVGKALAAVNCEFRPKMVRKRYGFGEAFDANEAITGMYNWVSNLGNYLLWFLAGTGVKIIDVTANPPTESTIISTASGHSAIFTDAGDRLLVSIFGTNGRGATQGYIISKQSGSFVADKLFAPPITYTGGTPTEPSAGVVTAGVHKLAYCIEYRGGFLGRLSPDSGAGTTTYDTFAPRSFDSAEDKKLQWILDTTWPTDAVKVHILMAPVSDPENFRFVPDVFATVTGGASESKTFTINVTDEFLLSLPSQYAGTKHRLFMTRTVGGGETGPFSPSVIVPLGDRMGYITTRDDNVGNPVSVMWVSERQNHQQVAADVGVIELPGQREITTAVQMLGSIYIWGPNWTYATSDNNLFPAQWPVPHKIDGQKGTPAPRGVTVAADGSHAWVPTKEGLYYFNGAYAHLPISYEQSDVWRTINWNYGYMIQVAENAEKKVVAVLVPLGAATAPSHILCWNYRKGMTPSKADYSSWTFSSYSLGALALVQNELTGVAAGNYKKLELWTAPSDADAILRQMTDSDSLPYRDDTAAVSFQYDTALVPKRNPAMDLQHHRVDVRSRGAGILAVRMREMDIDDDNTGATQEEHLGDIQLSSAPAKQEQMSADMIAQAKYLRFTEASVDGWVELTDITDYTSLYATVD